MTTEGVERFRTPGVTVAGDGLQQRRQQKLATARSMPSTTDDHEYRHVTLRASFANDDEALFPNEFVNVQMLARYDAPGRAECRRGVLSGAPGNYVTS